MEIVPSESSLIVSHSYDPDSQRLTLEFRKGGNVAHYHSVSPETYAEFEASPSHGKFFHTTIARNHRHEPG